MGNMRNKLLLVVGVLVTIIIVLYVSVQSVLAPISVVDQNNNQNIMSNSLTLTSPSFLNGGIIPSQFTCDGENTPPPLTISGVPSGTKSLVLVVDDSDIPQVVKDARGIEKFDHWSLYNIPPETTEIIDSGNYSVGENGVGELRYTGPCPPPGLEPREHRYSFRLYALSGTLNFIKAPTLDELELAVAGMMIEKTELIGRYRRLIEPGD